MNIKDHQQLLAMRQNNIGRFFQRAARDYSELALQKLHARGYNLSLFHTALISNLDVEGNNIQTLADRAGISKQAMGQLVKELEQQGFITRQPDPDDKRASIIQFTESGWQALRDSYEVKLEIEAEYTAKLGEDGIIQLRQLLQLLLEESGD